MREKNSRVCGELTAMLNGRLERELMSAEPLPDRRKNLLASEPRYRPTKKSGNNAQNDSYHGFLLFISLKCRKIRPRMRSLRSMQLYPDRKRTQKGNKIPLSLS